MTFSVCRIGEIENRDDKSSWLIESIWLRSAAGLIGGSPKCCKSWLGLEMATAVSSGTPCLGRFKVVEPGPSLVYLAEDSLPEIKLRVQGLSASREIDFESLPLHIITTPTIRLDLEADRNSLKEAVSKLKPRLVLLDPLVRLHRLDENSARDVSGLLGYFREIQREFDTAVIITHHVSKKGHERPGQALRGSTDLHAFGDSNVYLCRKGEDIRVNIEHRAASSQQPFNMRLISHGASAYLSYQNDEEESSPELLTDKIKAALKSSEKPMTRTSLRENLRINNSTLGLALYQMEKAGHLEQTSRGWTIKEIVPERSL